MSAGNSIDSKSVAAATRLEPLKLYSSTIHGEKKGRQKFTRQETEDGVEYFVNVTTNIPVWELPEDGVVENKVRQKFTRQETEDGIEYFVNTTTNISVWELPEDGVVETIGDS